MKTWLSSIGDTLRSSLWLVPSLQTLMAGILAGFMLWIDNWFEVEVGGWMNVLYAGEVETVRSILSSIVTAMITVVAVVFSITIVALTMAATQLGPRLLRNFMRDRVNQIVLGTFIGTFLYCVLVLHSVGRLHAKDEIPHISVLGALVLTLMSLGVLIYFVHHIASMIQAPKVAADVSRELESAIDKLYPDEADDAEQEEESWERREHGETSDKVREVKSKKSNFLQAVDTDSLLELAVKHDLRLRLLHRPGDFVIEGEGIARVSPGEALVEELEKKIRRAFYYGHNRTATQDIEFVAQELVEVAVRALSPSINDPITAMTCVDRLGAALCRLAGRKMSRTVRCEKDGQTRLVYRQPDFDAVLRASFELIRQYGRQSVAVNIRLLEALEQVATRVRSNDRRAAVLRQADMIHHSCRDAPEEGDRQAIQRRYERVTARLGGTSRDADG